MTATEAERNRRRGLTPWWRVRSWSKDLDTLIRLHKGLRALDADAGAEQELLSAPALSAPRAELLAPPQDEVAHEGIVIGRGVGRERARNRKRLPAVLANQVGRIVGRRLRWWGQLS